MQMTENEIVRNYKQAKKKQEQIKILADLNLCTKKEIRDILEKHGCEVPRYGNRYTKSKPAETLILQNEEPIRSNETPESVIALVKNRMAAINEQMKPLEHRLEELSAEYNTLSGWLKLTENT